MNPVRNNKENANLSSRLVLVGINNSNNNQRNF